MKNYIAKFRTAQGHLRITRLCAYSPESAHRILKMAFKGISVEEICEE